MRPLLAIVTNADWYFWSHRLPIARAALAEGFEVLVVAGKERGYGPRIEAEGLRFIPLDIERGALTLVSELRTLRHLVRIYREECPALVHHVAVKAVVYGSIAARIAGIPLVVNALAGQGYLAGAGGVQGRMLASLSSLAYRVALRGRGHMTIFQNPDDLDFFVGSGRLDRKHAVLIRGSGVNLVDFAPSPEPEGVPTVLFSSRLLWNKGIGDLVQAADALRAEGQSLRLVVAGIPDAANPKSVPEPQLREWQARGSIEWLGLRHDMPEVIRQANVVALPSTYGEGVPKVLLEAAAAGRAILTTNTPGCREIVIDGVNGLLVPPGVPARLTDALRELLRDPLRRRAMGEAGRDLVEREFDEVLVARRTMNLYGRMLGDRFPRAAGAAASDRSV